VGKFITFFYAVLDSKEHRLTYCNAGHNPPMLVRADGAASELNAAGAVLGQFPDWVYEQSDVDLKRGDKLILFTDGLVEAMDANDEPFGEQQLIATAQQNVGKSAAELMDNLMQLASAHCGGHFQDDASMVVLKAL
jgi:sigma-B regulation protein RsbU (phosphoserine phosphatase)